MSLGDWAAMGDEDKREARKIVLPIFREALKSSPDAGVALLKKIVENRSMEEVRGGKGGFNHNPLSSVRAVIDELFEE